MPKDTAGDYTRKGAEEIAAQITNIAEEIRGSARLMSDPDLGKITVLAQNSLDIGLAGLRAWARALSQAVADERLRVANGNGSVSDSNSKPDKTRKKAS